MGEKNNQRQEIWANGCRVGQEKYEPINEL